MLVNANFAAFLQQAHLAFRSAISSPGGALAGADETAFCRLNKLAEAIPL